MHQSFSAAISESFEPMEMLLRVRLELLWYLHLKEPACVVGEHKQLYFALFGWPEGEDGIEDGRPKRLLGTINFFFGRLISVVFSLTLDCSAISSVDSAKESHREHLDFQSRKTMYRC